MRSPSLVLFLLLAPTLAGCANPSGPQQDPPVPFVVGPVVKRDGALALRVAEVTNDVQGHAWDVQVELGPIAQAAHAHSGCPAPIHATLALADEQRVDLLAACGDANSPWSPLEGNGTWRQRVTWDGTAGGHAATPGTHRLTILADVLVAPRGDVGNHTDRLVARHEVDITTARPTGHAVLEMRVERDPTKTAAGTFVAKNVGDDWAYFTGGGCIDQIMWSVYDAGGARVQTRPRVVACTGDVRYYRVAPGQEWRRAFDWDGKKWVADDDHGHWEAVAAGQYRIVGKATWTDTFGDQNPGALYNTTASTDVAIVHG